MSNETVMQDYSDGNGGSAGTRCTVLGQPIVREIRLPKNTAETLNKSFKKLLNGQTFKEKFQELYAGNQKELDGFTQEILDIFLETMNESEAGIGVVESIYATMVGERDNIQGVAVHGLPKASDEAHMTMIAMQLLLGQANYKMNRFSSGSDYALSRITPGNPPIISRG